MNGYLKIKILERFGSQADFAQRLGIGESVVSRVIRGRRRLPADQQAQWAKALKCAPQDIFGEESKD